MTKSEHMKNWSPNVLRVGISLVFLWFGSQQLLHTSTWIRLIPESVISMSGLTASTLVHFNGAFELVFGLCLLVGFFTKISSLLLALHLLSIVSVVGYGPIGVRDFGLSVATFAIFLYGVSSVSLDAWLCKKYEQTNSSM